MAESAQNVATRAFSRIRQAAQDAGEEATGLVVRTRPSIEIIEAEILEDRDVLDAERSAALVVELEEMRTSIAQARDSAASALLGVGEALGQLDALLEVHTGAGVVL